MPKKPNFILEVTIRVAEAYTLDTVARSPRMFKPKDVLSACDNLHVELKSGPAPQFIQSFVLWMLRDYFALAHRTGLYNRQINLWQSLSKVARVEVSQKSVGIFKRDLVPIYELIMQDVKQKPLVYALLVAGDPRPAEPVTEKSDFVGVYKNFLADSRRLTTITGMFICFAVEPFPEAVLKFLKKQTDSNHPVGRYEALIAGYAGPVNLVACRLPSEACRLPSEDTAGTDIAVSEGEGSEAPSGELEVQDMSPETQPGAEPQNQAPIQFELVYPDLTRKTAGLTL